MGGGVYFDGWIDEKGERKCWGETRGGCTDGGVNSTFMANEGERRHTGETGA